MKQRTKTKIANGLAYTAAILFLLACAVGLVFIAIMSWKSALAIVVVVALMGLGHWVNEHADL